jgi:hypothetical protein
MHPTVGNCRMHEIVHRLATAPMRRSHSSRLPRRPSSQAVLKQPGGHLAARILLLGGRDFRRLIRWMSRQFVGTIGFLSQRS